MNAPHELDGTLSAEMAELMDRVALETGPLPDPTTLPPAVGRAQTAQANLRWSVNLPPMQHESEVWVEADDALASARCRVRILVPHNASNGAVLFVHGGGFAFCSPETHERCARVLAIQTGLPVLLPDYRLAPEHPFPAGLKDVVAVLRAAFDASAAVGVTKGPLLVSGDSAGANLALAAMLHEQAASKTLPDGALLFYGNYAHVFDSPSYRRFADGPGLTLGKMQRYWAWYLADQTVADDPLACPLAASDEQLAGLPPLYLAAAAVDPLLSDTLRLHARLQAIGRNDELSVVSGVTHGFLQNTNELAAAREVLAAAGLAAKRITKRR